MSSKGLLRVLQEKDKHIADLRKCIAYDRQLYKQQIKENYQLKLTIEELKKELNQLKSINAEGAQQNQTPSLLFLRMEDKMIQR